jgi:hypothetical protein
MVRQILGAVAEFEKASLVAKLKAARDRKRHRTGKAEGRKSHAEMNPDVALAKRLRRKRRNGAQPSLRDASADLARQNQRVSARIAFAIMLVTIRDCASRSAGASG